MKHWPLAVGRLEFSLSVHSERVKRDHCEQDKSKAVKTKHRTYGERKKGKKVKPLIDRLLCCLVKTWGSLVACFFAVTLESRLLVPRINCKAEESELSSLETHHLRPAAIHVLDEADWRRTSALTCTLQQVQSVERGRGRERRLSPLLRSVNECPRGRGFTQSGRRAGFVSRIGSTVCHVPVDTRVKALSSSLQPWSPSALHRDQFKAVARAYFRSDFLHLPFFFAFSLSFPSSDLSPPPLPHHPEKWTQKAYCTRGNGCIEQCVQPNKTEWNKRQPLSLLVHAVY